VWNEDGLLPDAIHKRDHTGGAMVNGKLCVASGRDGGQTNFFDSPILPTDCFNFETTMWEAAPDIPNGRSGAAVGHYRSTKMVVAGGEGFGKAFNNVDVFDGYSWTSATPLKTARHGTGLATGSSNCGFMYVASGEAAQGGSNPLYSTEQFWPNGTAASCRPK
jgi:hypothetical protein